MVFESVPVAFAVIVLFHTWASWPPQLRRYTKAELAIRHIPVKAALRLQSPDDYMSSSSEYRLARLIAHTVPAGEKVLVLESVAEFYAERETLICYEGALNDKLCDMLTVAWDPFSAASRALVFRFPERALQAIRVVQTAKASTPDEQWSIYELRLYRGAAEVPRAGDWRLNAFPNPWDVPYAFDNSPVTRWRTWETAAPNMYVTVRFPAQVRADQVRIETSADNSDLKLRLEEIDSRGMWKTLSAAPEEFTLAHEDPYGVQRPISCGRTGSVTFSCMTTTTTAAAPCSRKIRKAGILRPWLTRTERRYIK